MCILEEVRIVSDFMQSVNYLMGKEPDKWGDFAIRHGKEDIAYLACGSSKGRWWSVV